MYDLYPGITMQQLRVFLVAANNQSFSKTAAELNMTVSSVSRIIASLEAALGVSLFDRNKQRVKLSASGEQFYTDLKPIFKRFEMAVSNAREDAFSGQREIIRMADLLILDMNRYLLPIVSEFEKKNPKVSCILEPVTYDDMYNGLIGGKYDFSFISESAQPFVKRTGLTYRHLLDGVPNFVISDNHPLFKKEDLNIEDLKGQRIVALDSGFSEFKKKTFSIYEHYGFPMNDVTMVPTAASASFELKKGNCIALFSSVFAAGRDDLRTVEIDKDIGESNRLGFGIVYDESRLTPNKRKFIKEIESHYLGGNKL